MITAGPPTTMNTHGMMNMIIGSVSQIPYGAFIAAPLWATAILMPLCLLGLAAWQGAGARRVALTVAAYLVAFAVVGKPFNTYWGALYTPLMMIGLAFVPAALRDLFAALRADGKAA